MNELFWIGLVCTLVGIVLLALSFAKKVRVEVGIGGFIGPIPFGFATQHWLLLLIAVLCLVVALSFLLSKFL